MLSSSAQIEARTGGPVTKKGAASVREGSAGFFGPIAQWLSADDVIEIMANPCGSVFIERFGQDIRHEGSLRPTEIEAMVRSIATKQGLEAGVHSPIVSGELEGYGHRFEGLLPPAASSASFSIRKHASVVFPLDSYVERGALSLDGAKRLGAAVAARENILVAGGTGSGKTTFLNALFGEIATQAPLTRAIVIEDTREIQSELPNTMFLRSTPSAGAQRLVKSALRLRPDRIIIGELRDGVALDALKAWNTGHPGGLASIHANGAKEALLRMGQLIREVSVQNQDDVIGMTIDLVVFLKRGRNGPVVEDIQRVGWSDGFTFEKA